MLISINGVIVDTSKIWSIEEKVKTYSYGTFFLPIKLEDVDEHLNRRSFVIRMFGGDEMFIETIYDAIDEEELYNQIVTKHLAIEELHKTLINILSNGQKSMPSYTT